MLFGSIPVLIDILYNNFTTELTEKLIATIYTLNYHMFSVTVRNFISQILFLRHKQLAEIVTLCKSEDLLISFFTCTIISFLLLNNDNVPFLRTCNALESLISFCETNVISVFKFNFTEF